MPGMQFQARNAKPAATPTRAAAETLSEAAPLLPGWVVWAEAAAAEPDAVPDAVLDAAADVVAGYAEPRGRTSNGSDCAKT